MIAATKFKSKQKSSQLKDIIPLVVVEREKSVQAVKKNDYEQSFELTSNGRVEKAALIRSLNPRCLAYFCLMVGKIASYNRNGKRCFEGQLGIGGQVPNGRGGTYSLRSSNQTMKELHALGLINKEFRQNETCIYTLPKWLNDSGLRLLVKDLVPAWMFSILMLISSASVNGALDGELRITNKKDPLEKRYEYINDEIKTQKKSSKSQKAVQLSLSSYNLQFLLRSSVHQHPRFFLTPNGECLAAVDGEVFTMALKDIGDVIDVMNVNALLLARFKYHAQRLNRTPQWAIMYACRRRLGIKEKNTLPFLEKRKGVLKKEAAFKITFESVRYKKTLQYLRKKQREFEKNWELVGIQKNAEEERKRLAKKSRSIKKKVIEKKPYIEQKPRSYLENLRFLGKHKEADEYEEKIKKSKEELANGTFKLF